MKYVTGDKVVHDVYGLGNSMAVSVMRWIGERIQTEEE